MMFANGLISTFLRLPLVLCIIFKAPGLLCISLGNDEGNIIWEITNRDGELPAFPPQPDLRRQSTNIANAHQVLRLTLQQYLDAKDSDLGVYLKSIRERPDPFQDEYGQIITSYKKVFLFISEQFDEFKTQNYAVNQYDKDKLHLCSVARYLSHQPLLKDRQTLMKRMSDALDYKCHPCTPYKLKQHGTLDDIQVPDIDYLNSSEAITPDESLLLCNNTNLNTTALVIVSQSSSEVASSTTTERPTSAIDSIDKNETKNRDGDLPSSSFSDEKNNATLRIAQANAILRIALKSFLDFRDTDLDTYLHRMIQRTENYTDEYGQVIHAYKKVFSFILQQYKEVKVNNYAVGQFDKDKLDLCSVARFLSHQPKVDNRQNLMKRMGDALEYRCHPCTPYKRKEHDVTIVPETDNINPDGVSPEESLILCKNHGALIETTTPNNLMAITEGLDGASCEYSKGIVNCELVSIEDIQNFFSRSTANILEKVGLIIQPSDNFLPEDLISNNVRVAHLILGYSQASWIDGESGPTKLKVHPDAFRSSKNYTQKIDLNDFDCSELNLSFLSGFDQLKNLTFSNVLNMHHCLPSLPPIPNLILLDFQRCSGLGEVASFPNLTNGLIFFGLSPIPMDESLNDQTISRILDWILLSSSNTLQFLKHEDNKYLTRVPNQIPSFIALKSFILRRNNISIIETGSLTFSSPLTLLNLYGNGIEAIEPGAFQGDFSNAAIYLENNNLSRFEASVFEPIYLQNLPADKLGGVNLRDNPFDCSSDECHLAWFFNMRKRFPHGKFDCICLLGRCSNGTLFSELHLDAFNRCPDEDETK